MRVAFSNAARIWGGGEVMTAALARGLSARGHEVVLLCRRGSELEARLGSEFPCASVLGGFDFNPSAVLRSAAALRRHRPDVLVTVTHKDPPLSGVAARLLGVPVVMRHAVAAPFRPVMHRLPYGWVPRHYVATSRATRDTMLGSAPWLREDEISVIHNGVDVEGIAAAPAADLGIGEGALAIGFVGRLETKKGLADLVDAWPTIAAGVPEAHLFVVGRGGDLEREAPQRLRGHDRVHWLGFRDDVPAVLRALDLLVIPSHQEGFGLVAAEAMAAGTAVAAARTGALPELVTDGENGRLFQPRDPASLADTVVAMLTDPEGRARMVEAGAARARCDFSFDRMIDAYETVLTDVARTRHGGRR